MSNRFVGPMYRLRNTLRQLADGESVHPIKLREKDFWIDVADDVNRVIKIVQDAEPQAENDSVSLSDENEVEVMEPESIG